RHDHLIEIQIHVRVIADYLFAQRGYPGLQSVAALLVLNDANSFTRDDFRRRQIRFTQAEADAARLRAIRNLADHAFLNAAQEWRWLERIQWANYATFRLLPASR